MYRQADICKCEGVSACGRSVGYFPHKLYSELVEHTQAQPPPFPHAPTPPPASHIHDTPGMLCGRYYHNFGPLTRSRLVEMLFEVASFLSANLFDSGFCVDIMSV